MGPPPPFDAPERYEFLQAVRLLAHPSFGRKPIGRDDPADEPVRFSVLRSLGFPAGEIHDLTPAGPGEVAPRMTVSFFGLTGPSGVLPTWYTEAAIEQEGEDGSPGPLSAFFDLFHHRLLSLFFRAWERNHPHVSNDPEVRASFLERLLDFTGETLGTAPASETPGATPGADRSARPWVPPLRYAGLFADRRRGAEGLVAILEDLLNDPDGPLGEHDRGVRVEVMPFVARWIEVAPDSRSSLGRGGEGGGLGRGGVLGQRARDYQGRFRLRVGPLPLRLFRLLQPGPAPGAYQALCEIARRYVGPEYDFDVRLVVRAEEVPDCLFQTGGDAPRLGRSWIISRPPSRDAEVTLPARAHRSGPG